MRIQELLMSLNIRNGENSPRRLDVALVEIFTIDIKHLLEIKIPTDLANPTKGAVHKPHDSI